jgi:predicted MFS family arabinose efflux permease
LGGFGMLCVPWLWRSLKETRRFSERSDSVEAGDDALSSPPLMDLYREHGLRLAALVGVTVPVAIILEPGSIFISKHLQDDLGYSPGQVGLLLAACGVAAPLGNLLAGMVSDRFGRRPVTIAASLCLSLSIGIFYNGTGIVAISIGLALLMTSMGGLLVLHTVLSTELFPTAFRSTASGVREAVTTLGGSAGLWVLALLYGVTGSHPESITWILVLTPISPLVLLFVPETANRELEEIAPERMRGG